MHKCTQTRRGASPETKRSNSGKLALVAVREADGRNSVSCSASELFNYGKNLFFSRIYFGLADCCCPCCREADFVARVLNGCTTEVDAHR